MVLIIAREPGLFSRTKFDMVPIVDKVNRGKYTELEILTPQKKSVVLLHFYKMLTDGLFPIYIYTKLVNSSMVYLFWFMGRYV